MSDPLTQFSFFSVTSISFCSKFVMAATGRAAFLLVASRGTEQTE